jgi:hypothetical protein
MTDCIGAPAREWLERYVDGTLPDAEAQQFEEHYFECSVCLTELQALQAARKQLEQHPVSAPPRRRVLSWPVLVSFGAMAAALLIGYLTVRTLRHPEPAGTLAVAPPTKSNEAGQAAQQIAQLADLQLPVYRVATLRDGSEGTAFERGMKQYAAGDCTGARRTLAKVDAQGPDGLAAQFYSGVCAMHAGDFTGASSLLRSVASTGDSPEQESAWYYLAQISLARSDAADARQELDHVLSLHGDLEDQARKQLAQLPQAGQK